MPHNKVLFTADVHGNRIQYQKLFDYAKEISADTILVGGDITPMSPQGNILIDFQRRFLENELPELVLPLKKALPDLKLFIIMGNDDCAANLGALEKYEPELYHMVHEKRIRLSEDFDIIGYSYVPITPFSLKDWEKFDLSQVPVALKEDYAKRKRINYELHGFKSSQTGWKVFSFVPEMEHKDSIQKDLEKELFTKDAAKTLYMIHTPPNNTNLDKILRTFYASDFSEKASVGSFALRLFIEKYQPYLTLHGHIHETVHISGSFKDMIGETLCLAPGNHSRWDNLTVLIFDLYSPRDAKRITL